jgi:hypothetical protein
MDKTARGVVCNQLGDYSRFHSLLESGGEKGVAILNSDNALLRSLDFLNTDE